jgi:hypothetical protein
LAGAQAKSTMSVTIVARFIATSSGSTEGNGPREDTEKPTAEQDSFLARCPKVTEVPFLGFAPLGDDVATSKRAAPGKPTATPVLRTGFAASATIDKPRRGDRMNRRRFAATAKKVGRPPRHRRVPAGFNNSGRESRRLVAVAVPGVFRPCPSVLRGVSLAQHEPPPLATIHNTYLTSLDAFVRKAFCR